MNTYAPVSGNPNRGNVGSLSRQLIDLLTERIHQRELKAGDRFPTEIELIEQYGVSRTVVREAVSSLKADGLVETRHGIGTFVLEPSRRARVATDPKEVQTIKEVLQLLQFRISLEPETAFLAAQRRSEEELAGIRAALDELIACRARADDSTAADFAFHKSIANASGNRFYAETLSFLGSRAIPRAQVRTHQFQTLPRQQYLDVVNQQHEAVFDAIAAGQAEQARDAMLTHLTTSMERLRNAIAADNA
ncbi:FadR/GntR family transcriptional regulator [Noviherbaspirillum saxi]|uniref:FadR family transcriptional regulator n=1 Tax=Noviherbaspirillum saxi TaxID=2320863 RepID=A0A3A3FFS3_9BURK|nr:FadR/GntR family transcriptional regulator [Noviherbaspirillum saxi]RJF92191.1 FadR family transcriptional regulator [Noviherbaspirillum saxi]